MEQSLQTVKALREMLTPPLGKSGDVPTMVRLIVDAATHSFAPDVCNLTALNPETGTFLLPLAAKPLSQAALGQPRPQPNGMTQRVLDAGRLIVPSLADQPELANAFTATHHIRSFVAIALRTRPKGIPLGVLYLNYHQPRQWDEADLSLLDLFVEQASAALQYAWLLFRYDEVTRISQEINQRLDRVEAIFQRLAERIASILDVSYAITLALYQRERETLDFHILEGGAYRLLADQPFAGGSRWVIQEQRPLLIHQLSQEAPQLPTELIQLSDTNSQEESLLFVPLMVGEAVANAHTYLTNNQHRMQYARYRAQGLQVGSGSIESGCKHVLGARLKQAGMMWSRDGAQAVAKVRARLKSGRWDETIAQRPPLQRGYVRRAVAA